MESLNPPVLRHNGEQNLQRKSPYPLQSTRAHQTQDAVDLLNTLQTPYAVLRQQGEAGIRIDKSANEETRKCLTQIGYSVQLLRFPSPTRLISCSNPI